jgi:hypothetical protein
MKESAPNEPKKPEIPELGEELLRRVDEDQSALSSPERFIEISQKNTARLKEIISEIGWPTKSKVGEDASHAAWLIAQHSDYDLDFQKECLELLKAQPQDEIQLKEIGYLEDRVRVHQGLPQLYGTQGRFDEQGTFTPLPIEDPELLDERRKSLRMGDFEGYKRGYGEHIKGQE